MENTTPETAMVPEESPAAPETGSPAGNEKKAPKLKLPGKRKHRWIKVVIVLAVLAGAGYGAYRHFSGKSAGQVDTSYLVAQAARQDLTVSVSGTATLLPADSFNVTTLISGEIMSAPFEEGAQVQKDQLLFTLDGKTAQNSVNQAQISSDQAALSYLQAKEAMYPTATLSGTVEQVYVKNGENITAGTQLAKIADVSEITADFMFDEAAAANLHVGEAATVYVGDFEGSVTGTVAGISSSSMLASTGSGMKLRTVRVKLSNPGMVNDDYNATATIGGYASYGTSPVSFGSSAIVYATGSGTVGDLAIMAGDRIARGTVLCTIQSESNSMQLKNAKLSMNSSKISISTAQDTMDGYTIKSPIAGKVITKNFKQGDTVKGMDSGNLAVIYDMSYLKLNMNVDELDIEKVKVGQSVEITASALEGQKFTGTVDKVSINGTTTNGMTTYPVTIIIREFGSLLPGMNVSAKILGETVKDVLCIPVDAVSRGNVVYVPGDGAMNADKTGVVDASKVTEKEIALGRNDEEYIEVTDGLSEGDIVLIQNQSSSAMQQMMGG